MKKFLMTHWLTIALVIFILVLIIEGIVHIKNELIESKILKLELSEMQEISE